MEDNNNNNELTENNISPDNKNFETKENEDLENNKKAKILTIVSAILFFIPLIGLPFIIYTRIKYPKYKPSKILMTIYITAYVVFVIYNMGMTMVACYKTSSSCYKTCDESITGGGCD